MAGQAGTLIPIVQKSYDLCTGLYTHVDRFPRAQRGLLGRVMIEDGLQMLVQPQWRTRLSRAIFGARDVRNLGKRLLVRTLEVRPAVPPGRHSRPDESLPSDTRIPDPGEVNHQAGQERRSTDVRRVVEALDRCAGPIDVHPARLRIDQPTE